MEKSVWSKGVVYQGKCKEIFVEYEVIFPFSCINYQNSLQEVDYVYLYFQLIPKIILNTVKVIEMSDYDVLRF